jgi:ParB family chromosome partitioning protein
VAEIEPAAAVDNGSDIGAGMCELRVLRVAEWNARKTFDPKSIAELADSIRMYGIQNPLIVREIRGRELAGGGFEIIAGHRRFKAAQLIGLAEVPVSVREYDDATARKISIVDNLQREDVPPMEEAVGFSELLASLGSAEAVAATVGKEVAYVAKRLKLCTLGEQPRRALAERLITIDHALLLARVGLEEQDQALKWCLDTQAGSKVSAEKVVEASIKNRDAEGGWRTWEPESVLRLKEHLEESVGRKLSRAPWRLDQVLAGPELPVCLGCPSNTADNTSLFGDLAIDEATCADGKCFEAKRERFVQIALADAGALQHGRNGEPAIRVSWKQTSVAPRKNKEGDGFNLYQTFKAGQWVEAAKQSCGFLRAAVTVDWSDSGDRGYMGGSKKLRKPGEQITVCIAEGCKAHRKEWEKPKSSNGAGGYDAKAEEEKREKKRLAALAETKLRVRLAGEALDKVTKLSSDVLRAVLAQAYTSNSSERECLNAACPGLVKTIASAKTDSAEFARAVAALSLPDLHVGKYNDASSGRGEFIKALRRLGYDASKAWEKPKAAAPDKAKAKPAKKAAKKSAKKGGRK